jgi:antitoxin YxxD
MGNKYDYLRKYIPGGNGENDNWFCPIPEKEILQAESQLGYPFPSELRDFYQEIGYGMLRSPAYPEENYEFYDVNTILPPTVVANFTQGILVWDDQDYWIAEDTYEDLQPGYMPFFEIGDSSRFLIMRPLSENPNAVWTVSGIKIEDSFGKFVWRLYYESPWFYDDIVEAHYSSIPVVTPSLPKQLTKGEELVHAFGLNKELARSQLLKTLNNSVELKKLKDDLNKVPLAMLEELAQMIVPRSPGHREACEDLIIARQFIK